MQKIDFKPLFGLSSRHLQMIIACYLPAGKEPPTQRWFVDVGNGDKLSCEVSTPPSWKNGDQIVVLIHGLGGNAKSSYMIRMARKLYEREIKCVRINFRGCGSGKGLSKLPCGAGNSRDVQCVLEELKKENPKSDLILIGYSLGANTTLKLAGELGENGTGLLKKVIAVCPPLDLEQTLHLIQSYHVYHQYYLRRIIAQARPWIKKKPQSIYEFDNEVTGPLWGFSGADEYYHKCSSRRFIDKIRCDTHIILALDDPFISPKVLQEIAIPHQVQVWVTEKGSHLGFLGHTTDWWDIQWLDEQLLNLL